MPRRRSRPVSLWLAGLEERIRRPVRPGSYAPEIDGLRFIAIAVVVIGHFMERAARFFPSVHDALVGDPFGALLLRPGLGVYLFFAISGFVITRQALKADASPLSGSFLKAYFGRRILRIEPPYIILLVGTFLLIAASGYRPDQTNHFEAVPSSLGVSLVASIFYLHDLLFGTYPRLFPPGWSLEIEVQFYLLAPLLFWAFLKARSPVVRIGLGASGLFAGALVSLVAPRQIGAVHTDVSILLFFHFFWLGIVLAHAQGWILARASSLPSAVPSLVGWIGLVLYLVMPNAPTDDLVVAMAIRAATLATVVAMFASAFTPGSSFRAFCARPWISLIGGACYSIYLTHLQMIQALTSGLARLEPHAPLGLVAVSLVVEIAAVVAVGMLFYVLIERPFMLKDWPERAWAQVRSGFRTIAYAFPSR